VYEAIKNKDETGDTSMSHFNYYSETISGDKCYRIVHPKSEMVWDKTAASAAGGLVAYALCTYANGNIALTLAPSGPCFPVTLPSNLPQGDYDLLFFSAAHGSAVASDYELGFAIKWSGSQLQSIRQLFLTDRVK